MAENGSTLVPHGMEEEIERRMEKVRRRMEPGTALLVSTNVNIFYLTGRLFRGYIWLPAESDPIYFVVKPQIYALSGEVEYIHKPELIAERLALRGTDVRNFKAVGLEDDVIPYSDSMRLRNALKARDYFSCTSLLRGARMVKTPYEQEQMKIDGIKQAAVYGKISGLYKSGMTDLLLQIAIENELRLAGCLGYARVAGSLMEINMGSVLAGDNADNPSPYEFAMGGEGVDPSLPGGANGTPIRKGQTVMVDVNGAFNAYQTDMTRVWSPGDLPPQAIHAQECSIRILRILEKESLPGVPVCDLYFRAVEIAREARLEDFFMGHAQKSGFIGHGVGIELNEQPPVAPRCRTALEEGMTLALEPKFVIPGVGAVGVENTYIVRRDGLECITIFSEAIQPLG